MKKWNFIIVLLAFPMILLAQNVKQEDIPTEWKDNKYSNLLSFIQNEDYEQAFVEASILAGTGDVKGQYVLASMFSSGAGTYRNYDMMGGFDSLEKMHDFYKILTGEPDTADDVEFWNQMMSTQTLPKNYKEAFKWFYLPDGEWGYRDIMYNCGLALITGKYGYKNPKHGLNWIMRSAKLGYGEAIQLLNKLSTNED